MCINQQFPVRVRHSRCFRNLTHFGIPTRYRNNHREIHNLEKY